MIEIKKAFKNRLTIAISFVKCFNVTRYHFRHNISPISFVEPLQHGRPLSSNKKMISAMTKIYSYELTLKENLF